MATFTVDCNSTGLIITACRIFIPNEVCRNNSHKYHNYYYKLVCFKCIFILGILFLESGLAS